MRLVAALKSDLRFQLKQGFYLVYLLLTAFYLIILYEIPEGIIKQILIPLIVFSDPAIVGFFFIGGIVMLEKQQGIIDCLAVTPLDPKEYLLSKTASLSAVAVAASLLISLVASRGNVPVALLVVVVLLNSIFFTLYGFLAAGGCRTINQYFLRAIPLMLFAFIPCVSFVGFPFSWVLRVFPSVAGLELMLGVFTGLSPLETALYILILSIWCVIAFCAALRIYDNKILSGGAKE